MLKQQVRDSAFGRAGRDEGEKTRDIKMRTRQPPVDTKATQKSCGLSDSFAAGAALHLAFEAENVDVNIQPRTRGRRGLAGVATKKNQAAPSTQPMQDKESSGRAAKRRKHVAIPEKAAGVSGTQHSSYPASTQETPPTFAFTQGKQTFRKRKLLKKRQPSQECDQKRIEDLVRYFKGLDDQKLTFA